MKLLWHSNGPHVATGYGNQTALFAPRIRDAGYDVAISAFYGLHGAPLDWNGIRMYPAGYHAYGSDSIALHAADWFGGEPRDGLVVTLVDVWVLDPKQLAKLRVGCWTPVDHEHCTPRVTAVLREANCTPIAMSRHGEGELQRIGADPVYVPHGVDTALFQPLEREESRRMLDWPQDAFIVGMVAANKGYPPRKGFPEAIQAFSRFHKQHPEALLYLHTEPFGRLQGINLPDLLHGCAVPPSAVRFADPYRYMMGFSPEHMARLYSGMDVLLNPSYGEGFGIPMIEAQACGTPVISTNFTSMPEVGDAGWTVSGQRMWTEQGSYQMVPDIGGLVQALEGAFTMAPRMRERAREHALQYDADLVLRDYWLPALAELERRSGGFGEPAEGPVSEELAPA